VKEFTSVCPVTGQPDYYDIVIDMVPAQTTIESKSLKLWLWQYRDKGIFCEMLAEEVLNEVVAVTSPCSASVTIIQASRGGISIRATASTDQ
jgi:7-cyano-7-deazaguanine reductase